MDSCTLRRWCIVPVFAEVVAADHVIVHTHAVRAPVRQVLALAYGLIHHLHIHLPQRIDSSASIGHVLVVVAVQREVGKVVAPLEQGIDGLRGGDPRLGSLHGAAPSGHVAVRAIRRRSVRAQADRLDVAVEEDWLRIWKEKKTELSFNHEQFRRYIKSNRRSYNVYFSARLINYRIRTSLVLIRAMSLANWLPFW